MTRRWISLALVLPMFFAGLTAGTAADAPEWTVVLTDGPGDVSASGVPAPAPDPHLDLVSVSFADDPGWLHVKVVTTAANLSDTAPPLDPPVSPPPGTIPDAKVTVAFTVERENHTAGDAFRLLAEPEGRFTLFRGTAMLQGVTFQAAAGAQPWDFEVAFPRAALGEVPLHAQDRLELVSAQSERGDGAHDRAPDSGHGSYVFVTDPDGTTIPTWVETEGVDFAGGPSVAAASDGTIHVAYYVYRDERGTETGVWHGTVTESATGERSVTATRIGPGTFAAGDTQNTRDAQTQTRLAVDATGTPHVAYLAKPGTSTGDLRYATPSSTGWTIERPNVLASGDDLPTTGGFRSVPAIAVSADRTVVAFQSDDLDTIALVEKRSDGWHLLRELEEARFPKLALDSDGTVRMAFFRETSDQSPNRAIYGDLAYVEERGGWAEEVIASGVEDRSKFWESPETDGSFAFAVGPQDRSYFVYETDDEERGFVVWDGGEVSRETSPLTPVHGNIQNRMRMAIDASGNAHVVTGYGGADLYGMRSPNGAWLTQSIDRGDMFDMTVTPDGRAVTAATQPHGGTTLAVNLQSGQATTGDPAPAQAADPDDTPPTDWESVPAIGFPLMALGAIGGLMLFTSGVRTGIDRRPGWFAPAFAALGGFSRIQKDELLSNKTREEIVEAVRAHPGVPPAELRRRLDIPRSTFFYHLSRLETEGLLRTERQAGRVWLFTPDAPKSAAVVPVQEALERAARAEPGRTAAEYAERLGRSRRTVLHHLQELERRDRVTRYSVNPREVRWGILPDADLEEGG